MWLNEVHCFFYIQYHTLGAFQLLFSIKDTFKCHNRPCVAKLSLNVWTLFQNQKNVANMVIKTCYGCSRTSFNNLRNLLRRKL